MFDTVKKMFVKYNKTICVSYWSVVRIMQCFLVTSVPWQLHIFSPSTSCRCVWFISSLSPPSVPFKCEKGYAVPFSFPLFCYTIVHLLLHLYRQRNGLVDVRFISSSFLFKSVSQSVSQACFSLNVTKLFIVAYRVFCTYSCYNISSWTGLYDFIWKLMHNN